MVSRFLFAFCVALLAPLSATALETAPALSGKDVNNGRTVDLAELRGKVVLVDFWASWCPPCLESLPAYEAVYRDIGGPDFEIVAVNVDEDTRDGMRFLEERPVSYPVIADPEGRIGVPWRIRSLPRTFLVDRDGRIAAEYKRFRSGDGERVRSDVLRLIGDETP